MPEIWLNYGMADVVLDIRAENLAETIDTSGGGLEDAAIHKRLEGLDISRQLDLVILHNSLAVQKVIASIFLLCEQKSKPFPRILAGSRDILKSIRSKLPEGVTVDEFKSTQINSDLVFVGEVEFDGLFGYETIATRLIRRFGAESMLKAYSKRAGDLPLPGESTVCMKEAKKFTDNFEIQGIEIASSSTGITDISVDHPSKSSSAVIKSLKSNIRDAGRHRSIIVSGGNSTTGSYTLGESLTSLWNSMRAVKSGGIVVLVAECSGGLGSDAFVQYVEGRMDEKYLRNPQRYMDRMENLLFLLKTKEQQQYQTALISVLPDIYVKKLGMLPLPGMKHSLDYLLEIHGARHKIPIVKNGAQILLK